MHQNTMIRDYAIQEATDKPYIGGGSPQSQCILTQPSHNNPIPMQQMSSSSHLLPFTIDPLLQVPSPLFQLLSSPSILSPIGFGTPGVSPMGFVSQTGIY